MVSDRLGEGNAGNERTGFLDQLWLGHMALVCPGLQYESIKASPFGFRLGGVRFPIPTGGDLVLPLAGVDTFFVVRVNAGGVASPVFDYVPEPSFTNPLYVDRNGDGVFTP